MLCYESLLAGAPARGRTRAFRSARAWLPLLVLSMTPLADRHGLAQEQKHDRLGQAVEFYLGKRYEEAKLLLQDVVKANPEQKDAILWLARTRYELREFPAAREAYEQYAKLAPQDAEAYRGIARCYRQENKLEQAKKAYARALSLDPNSISLKQELQELEQPAKTANGESATAPPAAANGSASAPQAPNRSFWRSGVSGVTGARDVWWGWVIMILLFVWWMGSIMRFVPAQMAKKYAEMDVPAETVGPASFMGGLVGSSFWYFIFWGLPDGAGQWLLAAGILLFLASAFSRRTVAEFTG